jgi:prefoldin subunit 5
MPAANQKAPWQQAMPSALAEMFRQPEEQDLANEVAELRKEINLLRQELAPVPSMIITGRAVLDELKRLRIGA